MGGIRCRQRRLSTTIVVAVLAMVSVLASCVPPPPPGPTGPRDTTTTTAPPGPSYDVLGGVEQIYVLGAAPGAAIEISLDGAPVASGVADRLGSYVVRELLQGRTYTVTNLDSGDSRQVAVLAEDDHPDQSFYAATKMREGMNYVPMRDGITLNATVRPPIGASLSDGPFPTAIEYSGYQTAAPNEPVVAKVAGLLGLPTDPLAPGSETDVGGLLMRLAGFAVVSVQLRGTGCSGGEGDLFDLPTRLDGYDIVETVAAQRFVSGGKVGMIGISFSGFSQIATAATHPPHLAAIAPLSFVGSLYDLAHPGGIFNDGFAKTWMADRVKSARPAPDPGALPYANKLVATDAQCRHNQLLRLQTRDGDGLIRSEDLNTAVYQRRDFSEWMSQIEVPTFASLQFDDEETSSYAMLSAQDLLGANENVWLNLSSGHHRDSVTPETITQLFEFLDIYVGRRAPEFKPLIHLLSPVIFGEGSDTPPLSTIIASSPKDARRQFEARPRVRVLLELPLGSNEGRNTGTRWQFQSDSFPLPGSTARSWFLGADGSLGDTPGADGRSSYRPDPALRPASMSPLVSPSSETPGPTTTDPITWTAVPDGAGLGFVTAPLESDVVAIGPAAAQLTVQSDASDTDLGLTISEVRPDGQEMLVSTGVQRASVRASDPARSTPTRPALRFDLSEPLDGDTVDVPVQIMPLGHVFRAGSRIRVGIAAVGGDREKWAYDSVDPDGGGTTNSILFGTATPSSITMTIAPFTGYPATLLPCPSSGKPCRPWLLASNGG